jgi:hypothetical protein
LIIRLPKDKRERLKQIAKARNVNVNRLIDKIVTLGITEFGAESQFHQRATEGQNKEGQGRELLAKALQYERS